MTAEDAASVKQGLLSGMQPIGNYAVVEPASLPEKSAGGLFIPKASQVPTARGRVLKVGLGQKNGLNGAVIGMVLAEGDEILYHPSGLQTYEVDGVNLNIIHEGDVILVLNWGREGRKGIIE